MLRAGDFLEWADVFGNLYGTCASDVEKHIAAGRDMVLVIDVQGARQVRQRYADTVGVFVLPPSFETLEQRLRGRSKDPEEAMQRRLRTARNEVAGFVEYDYVIVNDELDACVERLRSIVLAERARLRSAYGRAEQILRGSVGWWRDWAGWNNNREARLGRDAENFAAVRHEVHPC